MQELARLAKLDYVEQTRKDEELHTQIAAERAQARYARHYDMCSEILSEIVDVACKVRMITFTKIVLLRHVFTVLLPHMHKVNQSCRDNILFYETLVVVVP